MKRTISLIFSIILCLSMFACGTTPDVPEEIPIAEKIRPLLIDGIWWSDREEDNGQSRQYNFTIYFYEDGSYKRVHTSHIYNWAWKLDPEQREETGTWTIEENIIILSPKSGDTPTKLIYSRDDEENKDILTGPQSEGGYTYYSYSGGDVANPL